MRTIMLIFCATVCAFADHVTLSNGDTITGSVIKKDGDKLTIHSEFLGDVSMPWKAVKSLQSDQDLTVVLPGGEMVTGKVATSGNVLEVGAKSAPLADISAVRNAAEQHAWERLQHPGLLELWTGNFDLGLALARGNAYTETLTNAFTATRTTRHDQLTVNFNQIYGTARVNGVTSTSASLVHGGWNYNHDLTPKVFLTVLNSYDYNQLQNLDLRFVVGGGAGWNARKGERLTLSFSGGGDYDHESFANHLSRNSAEVNVGDDLVYKLSGITTVTQTFRIFPNLSFAGEYRTNFILGVVTTLKKWLAWQVNASDQYWTNPPPGGQRNDLVLSTGFRLSFAR